MFKFGILTIVLLITAVLVADARVTNFDRTIKAADGTEWHVEGCVSWSVGFGGIGIDGYDFTATNMSTEESWDFRGGNECNEGLIDDLEEEHCDDLQQDIIQLPCATGINSDDCQFVLENVGEWVIEDCHDQINN